MTRPVRLTIGTVLGCSDGWLTALIERRSLLAPGAGLALLTSAGAAAYGFAFGLWHGTTLAAHVAVKLPLVLLLTSSLTLPFAWAAGALLGLRLRFAQAAVLAFLTLAVAALVLGSLAPVAGLFVWCARPPTPEARTAHNLMYLMHTAVVGSAGLAGSRALSRLLHRVSPTPRSARRAYACWVLAYAVVGGEVAWALRPFVGSVYRPVEFLRGDALDGNVYEFVFTDILPHLTSRGGDR